MSKKEMYEEELEWRIRLLENGASMPNAFMQKKDYIWVAVLCGVCLAGIIAGAFI